MNDNLYRKLPHSITKLEPHYSRHVLHMTSEDLFSKGEIAEELAYRDQQIESLRKQVEELRKDAMRYHFMRKEWFVDDASWYMQIETSEISTPDELDKCIDKASE